MSKRSRSAKKIEPPRLDGHEHALYGPWAHRLAFDVLEDDFGEAVRSIAEALVAYGPASLPELRSYLATKGVKSSTTGAVLSANRVRTCLLTLMTHGMVTVTVTRSIAGTNAATLLADKVLGKPSVEAAAEEDENTAYIYGALRYTVCIAAILRRLRAPAYLALVRRHAGGPGVAVAEQLLHHGPWHHDTCVARAAEAYVHALVAEEGGGSSSSASSSAAALGGTSRRGSMDESLSGRSTPVGDHGAGSGGSVASHSTGGGGGGMGRRQEISSEAAVRAYTACASAWAKLVTLRLVVPEPGLVSVRRATASAGQGRGLGALIGTVDWLVPELTGVNARGRMHRATKEAARADAAAAAAAATSGAAAADTGAVTASSSNGRGVGASAAAGAGDVPGLDDDDDDDIVVPTAKKTRGAPEAEPASKGGKKGAAAKGGKAAATAKGRAPARRGGKAVVATGSEGDSDSDAGSLSPEIPTATAGGGKGSSSVAAQQAQLWRFGHETASRMMRDQLIVAHVAGVLPLQTPQTSASSAAQSAESEGAAAHTGDCALASRLVRTLLAMSEEHVSDPLSSPCSRVESSEHSIAAILNRMRKQYELVQTAASSSATSSSSSSGRRDPEPAIPSAAKAYALLSSLARLPSAPLIAGDAVGSRPADDTRSFRVGLRNCVAEMERRSVLHYVQDRFSFVGARIVDLLLERGALDEKSASELAMVPGKDAKEALYRMLADGVLSQQEVPKRPDHHPQFTFFLFRAELHKLLTLMTERSHHALLNVRRRRRMETGRLAEATAIATATAGAAAVAGAAPITVSLGAASSGGMTKARARMLNAPRVMSAGVDRLLLSEARLDATLLLARDMHWLNWKAAR